MELDDKVAGAKGQAEAPDRGERERGAFAVVGIGASAGGLKAFTELLSALPEKTGMAFVLIQHLDPAHESQLAELLAKTTHLAVLEVTDGMDVEADHAYVIPPNVSMAIGKGGVLRLTPRQEANAPHLPVDFFFRSLAEERESGAIGVVLSGTGSDGSAGLGAIKAAGGITFAQDEASAEFAAMPQNAVAGGHVDFVLAPAEIARELARIGEHPYVRSRTPAQGQAAVEAGESDLKGDMNLDLDLEQVLARLRTATGVDFSEYRRTTLKRRIARRMALHKQESLPEYVRMLESQPKEIEALYCDMLINVTSFFRDPEVFEALKVSVFPEIVKGKSADNAVRIWVPGCSTGQEAYSLAMALLEYLDDKAAAPVIQIFGTDISDAAAVEKARPGIYPSSIEAEVSAGRLARFFVKVEHGYRINKTIRDMCVFAKQDVTTDPPFSRLDLVSCRNLLIYLSPALQQRIIPTFHYALNPGGFLLLGPSETVGRFGDLFGEVDGVHNIYSRTATLTSPYLLGGSYSHRALVRAAPAALAPALADMQREADRVLLGRFAPAAVLVDENLEILQFRGQTGPYLQAPTGQPTHNLLKMARESLFMELRNVLDEARKNNAIARRENVRVLDEQQLRLVNLEATPIWLRGVPQHCFLVLFMESQTPVMGSAAATGPLEAAPGDSGANSALQEENAQLRQELGSVKEYLQAIIEQQSAANEELQSANEEIRSANEELQSTNEELQTGREELQSSNEELRTVNDELKSRSREVVQLSDDLNNTLFSIKAPIVMLGRDLRIRRFTSAAGTILKLLPGDVGRPFGDIESPFELPNQEDMLREVIAKVASSEREVQDRTGHWYGLALYPYRTEDNRIDGVVMVLRDIDAEKRAKERLSQAVLAKDQFLAVLSHELRTPLTPVLATATMLLKDARWDADTRGQLEVIRRNAELEARLIDDLLDITRIARGKVMLEKRPVELAEVVQRAVEVCQPDIEAKHVEFGMDIKGGPHMVSADATRLQQVFWNLLKNAIKFTPQGGCVGVRCRGDGEGFVKVEVIDSGVGMPAEVIGGIFAAFEQGGAGTTRQFGGLGLGLTICKGLVEMHGGTIAARSGGVGKGATFTVRLPLVAAPAGGKAKGEVGGAGAGAPLGALRILLVEDHGDTSRIMCRLLSADGHHVEAAADMATALKLAGAQRFDLLLSDLGLPDGSGLELMRTLRAKGNEVPGIAVSGYGMESDIEESRLAGFSAHLTKPVSLPRLAETMAEVMEMSRGRRGGADGCC